MGGDTKHGKGKGPTQGVRESAFLLGLLSLAWFLLRTGRKPSRAVYPCQQVARLNADIWLATYILPALSAIPERASIFKNKKAPLLALILIAVAASSIGWWHMNRPASTPPPPVQPPLEETEIGAALTGRVAGLTPASDIFVLSGTMGDDGGLDKLMDLMGSQGLLFYESDSSGENRGPGGLISGDDVVLIKVNSQWDERGGTNTDLVKALIRAIIDHPEGFTGEVIVADNGQAQYGAGGGGGSLDWARNNAGDASQSIQRVVDSFSGSHRVSTYLWDTITTTRVEEYSDGDMGDGYVVNSTRNPRTGVMVSYPKFRTRYGTYVSFKHGLWDPEEGAYDGERLKVINVPVLKTHSGYGVTACVKHYMGVPSDRLTAQLGSRTHFTIGQGGLGTEMAETRFPVLNILDAIWVNAVPQGGPATDYDEATCVKVVLAGTDPVALDYYASKYILCSIARERGHPTASMDPDNETPGVFGSWLRLSMEEITKGGHRATVDEDRMNVYVAR